MIQFLRHRGYPVPSPACLQQIGDAFRRRVASFAEANHIPVVPLKGADRPPASGRQHSWPISAWVSLSGPSVLHLVHILALLA